MPHDDKSFFLFTLFPKSFGFGDVGANRGAACLEVFYFLFRQIIFHDFLDAVGANNRRDAAEDARFAVFAIERCAGSHDFPFIPQDSPDHGSRRHADAVFRTVLARIGDPAGMNRFILDAGFIEDIGRILFQFFQGFAAELDERPGNDLGIAVFPQRNDDPGPSAGK